MSSLYTPTLLYNLILDIAWQIADTCQHFNISTWNPLWGRWCSLLERKMFSWSSCKFLVTHSSLSHQWFPHGFHGKIKFTLIWLFARKHNMSVWRLSPVNSFNTLAVAIFGHSPRFSVVSVWVLTLKQFNLAQQIYVQLLQHRWWGISYKGIGMLPEVSTHILRNTDWVKQTDLFLLSVLI